MAKNITFRTHLVGGIYEFCRSSRINILSDTLHLVELIVMLARYKEEGVSLCPNVYITDNINAIKLMLPNSELIKIGVTTKDIDGIKSSLKKCAPLARDGWLIYLQDNPENLEYGLFKGSSNPISVLVDQTLMSSTTSDFNVVKAFQVADDCVEVSANNGEIHYVFLNHRKEESPPPLQYLNNLVDEITYGVIDEHKESTISFLRRLFFDSLRQSHGCIIAVTDLDEAPNYLGEDGIILDSPINFAELVISLKKKEIDPSYLESKGALLKGMLNSDGIIVFDNKSRLLGYNCFIKVENKETVIGGARKRAFGSVKSKIGQGIAAVFMQSQDGWTDFFGASHE